MPEAVLQEEFGAAVLLLAAEGAGWEVGFGREVGNGGVNGASVGELGEVVAL